MTSIVFARQPGRYVARGAGFLAATILMAASSVAFAQFDMIEWDPPDETRWWTAPPEEENQTDDYDAIAYSEIPKKLRELELRSNRVDARVVGTSAQGRNLFLVIVATEGRGGRFGRYKQLRRLMSRDPQRAQERIDEYRTFKVPVLIGGSIHGDEQPGTDAVIRLIEKLAFAEDEETLEILDNAIVLFNVVMNPDGRVLNTRGNGNGFDLNRDSITQSQTETDALVRIIAEWNPMIMLDLHGFVDPMLIEPTTPPHGKNYEYDLYIKWALRQAEAMEAEVMAQTGLPAQIPYRDFQEGWDDWPPVFSPMYAMYHGAFGHTIETPQRSEVGVAAHYAAAWGALRFVSQNKLGMVRDQIEIFRRGFFALPQQPIDDEFIDATEFDQFNELTIQEFPTAYVIPREGPMQRSPTQAARLVDFMLQNDVEVSVAQRPFYLNNARYPRGTFVVWMDQPKRGLANAILDDGDDVSFNPGLLMFDDAAWSHGLLWGATVEVADEPLHVRTKDLRTLKDQSRRTAYRGSVERKPRKAWGFAFRPDSNAAIRAINDLLHYRVRLYRAANAFVTPGTGREFGEGTILLPASSRYAVHVVRWLAREYGLDLFAVDELPDDAKRLVRPKIAIFAADREIKFVLDDLGFDLTPVSTTQLNAGALQQGGYDVFVNRSRTFTGLSDAGRASVLSFVARGGDYVGVGTNGSTLALDAGLMKFEVNFDSGNDGIVKVDYDQSSPVTNTFPADGFAFVNTPVWYTDIQSGTTIASIDAGDDFFVSGSWTDWPDSGAQGQAVILHCEVESEVADAKSDVTVIGIRPAKRAHPEDTFRILANAIYAGQD